MDAVYIVGMITSMVLFILLLTSAWQDYREELKWHHAPLKVSDEMVDLDVRSGVEGSHCERKTDALLMEELVSFRS